MEYKNSPNTETLFEIEQTLSFIRAHSQDLVEKAGESKWTVGNRVFCYRSDQPGMYAHMVGALKNGQVSWHMMPIYGVPELKERWSEALSSFLSGKSCIKFRHFTDLPTPALIDIVENGTPLFEAIMDKHNEKRRLKK